MNLVLPAEVIARIEAETIRAIHAEFKPLLATRKQAAEMLGVQERALKRIGVPVIQLPGQRDRYAISDIQAAVAAGRVK